jgi:D-3-phosphoglycerate dehydrogenase
VALRAQAFGMRVIAYDPFLIDPDTVRALGVELLPLDEVLASSDVLTLHRPGNLDGTPGLGAAELARLKPRAVLINTARGSLLDEGALHAQLDARRIRAAGLDVLAQEPAALHHPLVQHDGTLITPHAAWYSEESEQELRRRVAEIVLAGVQGAPSRTT